MGNAWSLAVGVLVSVSVRLRLCACLLVRKHTAWQLYVSQDPGFTAMCVCASVCDSVYGNIFFVCIYLQ
jgi:hypothetical protein